MLLIILFLDLFLTLILVLEKLNEALIAQLDVVGFEFLENYDTFWKLLEYLLKIILQSLNTLPIKKLLLVIELDEVRHEAAGETADKQRGTQAIVREP